MSLSSISYWFPIRFVFGLEPRKINAESVKNLNGPLYPNRKRGRNLKEGSGPIYDRKNKKEDEGEWIKIKEWLLVSFWF